MAASVTDKFRKLARKWVGQVGAGGVSDDTTQTIPFSSTTGLPTDTAVDIVLGRVDSDGTKTPAAEETITTVISGSNGTNSARGEEGTAQAHAAGAVAEVLLTANTWNDLVDGILVEHAQDGTHKDITLNDSINDTNGNELIKASATASAINEFTVANAATGNPPTLSATGGDTNIDLKLMGKGTGTVKKPASAIIQVLDGTTNTSTGDGKAYFTIPPELNGMVISGVFAAVVTAGTTGTTDIQIRNVTDSVDVLSTKLTIDSGETTSATAAAAAVINTSNDDVATNDVFAIDVDAVSTTPAQGLIVRITFGF